MKNVPYTEKMYQYLAWRLLQKVCGEVGWQREEEKRITKLTDEAGLGLTDADRKITENRATRITNEYREQIIEEFRREYGDEFDNGEDDFFFAPIDFNQEFYEIWKQGVAKQQTVKMKYDSTTSGISERLVDPYKSRAPYGEGYCHSRKEVRKFRFDRVVDIALTERKFEKPKN